MSDDLDELARLRRSAFGPTATAEERAAAAAALRRLDERARDTAATVPAVPTVTTVPGVLAPESELPFGADNQTSETESADAIRPAESSPGQRRIRIGWLIPIVVVSIILGVVGTLGATGQLTPLFGLGATGGGADGSTGRVPGDLEAADVWFNNSASSADAFPFADALYANEIQPTDLRFAFAGGHGWNVWVGHTADKLCLLIADVSTSTGAANCVDRAQFAFNGMSLELNGRVAQWYGHEVTAEQAGP